MHRYAFYNKTKIIVTILVRNLATYWYFHNPKVRQSVKFQHSLSKLDLIESSNRVTEIGLMAMNGQLPKDERLELNLPTVFMFMHNMNINTVT